ncbi:MAG TPA: cyclic nucleotide-binding domain-containing protein [Spirochaetia bacterium]|nr:cyclic nucleotide-binding domain-containing protein [Spirochaetia bacterium]
MEHHEILQTVPLFANISSHYIKGIAKSCAERSFKKGEYLVKQGNPGIGLFIIVSGKVKIVKSLDQGRDVEIATHGPGEVVGELAVLDGAPRTANVVAVEDTKTLVLASWAFNSFMESHPEVALQVLPIVVHRFRETNEALISLQTSRND